MPDRKKAKISIIKKKLCSALKTRAHDLWHRPCTRQIKQFEDWLYEFGSLIFDDKELKVIINMEFSNHDLEEVYFVYDIKNDELVEILLSSTL